MARAVKPADAPASSRRDEILAIAARVIAERGIAGATVRDIGQAAGILSGSLYHHFESKEQIVLDLLLASVTSQCEQARAICDGAADSTEALSGLIRASVQETAAHPNESLILRNEARAFRDSPALAPLADVRRKSLGLWVDAVSRGIRTGEFRKDVDADVAVRAMFDGVLGAARWFGSGGQVGAADGVADTLIAMYVTGLSRR